MMLVADVISLFTYRFSINVEVAFLMWSSCNITASTMDLIIWWGNMKAKSQASQAVLFTLKNDGFVRSEWFTNVHLKIGRFEIYKCSVMFNPCCLHSLNLPVQTLVSIVYALTWNKPALLNPSFYLLIFLPDPHQHGIFRDTVLQLAEHLALCSFLRCSPCNLLLIELIAKILFLERESTGAVTPVQKLAQRKLHLPQLWNTHSTKGFDCIYPK